MIHDKNTKMLSYLLTLWMLFFLIDLSWCRPRMSIFGQNQETCEAKLMKVFINLPDCEPLTVQLFGCVGYCRSDTTINIEDHGQSLVPKCNCCKPISDLKLFVAVSCPNRRGKKIENVELLTAKKCACRPCSSNLDPEVSNT